MAKILIIDDDEAICNALCSVISSMGHEAAYVLTLDEGLRRMGAGIFEVVFLDVRMPDGDGLEILPKIQEFSKPPEVVVMTAAGDPVGAEIAINSGAWGYMEKPSSVREILLPLTRMLQYREEKLKRESHAFTLQRGEIIGGSPRMSSCMDLAAHAAVSDANVLITGETGTGKDLVARLIHNNSKRREKGFVIVDCSTLTETLAENILFGHQKGAFTGAEKSYVGLVKHADGGTLFLDEVGEISLPLQKKFLRVLQEGRFRSLGGVGEEKSNFRLIAATNRDLDSMMRSGRFRDDLLFRLRTITIELPPLRERPEDMKALAEYYAQSFCERYGMKPKILSPEFIETLMAYNWPGNVRELRNVLEGIVLTSAKYDSILFPTHLPNPIRIRAAQASLQKCHSTVSEDDKEPRTPFMLSGCFREMNEVVSDVKRQYLEALLLHTAGSVEEACRISGVSRSRLYAYLKQYKISKNGEWEIRG